MHQTRFRTAVALAVLGGVLFVLASAGIGGNPMYGVAVALEGVALLVALGDPVARARPVMAGGLALGAAGAALDSGFTFANRTGTVTALGTALLVVGFAIAAAGRRAPPSASSSASSG